jgi:hypothetical protein
LASGLRRVYRRLRFGRPIVVVSGLPRSGTSMLMKMLEAGGLPLVVDGLRVADEDNPKGYYEDERVKALGQQSDAAWLGAARGKAIKIISYLLKELPPGHNYRVLLMRRSLKEVLASQGKMLQRRGEPNQSSDERMTELYESDLWKARYLVTHAPQFEALEVQYKDVVGNAREQAARINQFLGGGLNVEAMAAVVDRQLYRNRAD